MKQELIFMYMYLKIIFFFFIVIDENFMFINLSEVGVLHTRVATLPHSGCEYGIVSERCLLSGYITDVQAQFCSGVLTAFGG